MKNSYNDSMNGYGKHLFVDDTEIADCQGVRFTTHEAQKHEANPLLVPDQPWEGDVHIYSGGVIHDSADSLFKMWYGWSSPRLSEQAPSESGHSYALSGDGIHWEKPDLRHGIEYGCNTGFTYHNVIPDLSLGFGKKEPEHSKPGGVVQLNPEFFGICFDRFAPDPEMRYKTLDTCVTEGIGYEAGLWHSPNGINWEFYGPVFLSGSEVCPFGFDSGRRRYMAFPKVHGISHDGTRRRSVGMTTSRDALLWERIKPVLVPDEHDDKIAAELTEERYRLIVVDDPEVRRGHYYDMRCIPYADDYFVGLLHVFYASGYQRSPDWEKSRKEQESGGEGGVSDTRLVISRDLEHWHYPADRRAVISLGELLSWEGGKACAASILILQDEIWIYYTGGISTHCEPKYGSTKEEHFMTLMPEVRGPSSGVGLAKLRLDGFVSADAAESGGIVTTKSMVLEGIRLAINAEAVKGSVAVEVLDEHGNPLQGYERDQCHAFSGDELREHITWNEKAHLSELLGRKIRLRFYLKNARLYSLSLGG